jgi:hypothetical protein
MSRSLKSAFRIPNSEFPLGFGDALLVFYFVVLVRPWFWAMENAAAWSLTVPLAVGFWYFYVSTKERTAERTAASFWLIVGLPLLFVYALRAPFPDASFDVWSLRLFHGERALRGFIYRPGEFFPTSAPFNPTPDMLTGIFRHLLGYRLGTIVNLFALVWAGTVLDKLLRPFVGGPRLRALCVLLALFTEHVLFEINNYMPDLLALPLMLEATRLVLNMGDRKRAADVGDVSDADESGSRDELNGGVRARDAAAWKGADEPRGADELKRRRRVVVRVAFLVGASVALKLSNGAVCAPLLAVCAWRALRVRPFKLKALAADTLLSAAVFVAPLIPFSVWVYRLTGSPFFPIYNGYFRSPFYLPSNGWDGRWGGFGAREILPWPVLIFFEPERTAELGVYTGRLSVAFVVAVVCLLLARRVEARTRVLAFVVVLGSLLWSLTMGYIRYGLYLEVLSGLMLISLAARLLGARDGARTRAADNMTRAASVLRAAAAWLVCAVMVAQSVVAARYVAREEWSMRPTVFDEPGAYLEESKYILRDRSIRALLSDRERALFDRVGLWVVSGSKTAGLLPFLNDRAPVVGVRSAGIFLMDASRREFARALERFEGRAMYSIAIPEDYDGAVAALRNAGLRPGRHETVTFPFFAPSHPVTVYLFQVERETDADAPAKTQGASP